MSDQTRKAEQFRALHIPGRPLVLFNIWDAGSAKAVASAGARAIATGSWSVANANGFADGELIPLALAIDNLRRIVGATDLPVSIDLESGYGDTPEAVGETMTWKVTKVGADDVATIDISVRHAHATVNGKTVKIPAIPGWAATRSSIRDFLGLIHSPTGGLKPVFLA